MFGNDLVRFGPVRFGKKNSGSVRFGGSVKILVRSNTSDAIARLCMGVFLPDLKSKCGRFRFFIILFWVSTSDLYRFPIFFVYLVLLVFMYVLLTVI